MSENQELPSWVYDIDETDIIDVEKSSIFLELGIDLGHIVKCVKWALSAPFLRFLKRYPTERHPLFIYHSTSQNTGRTCLIILLFLFQDYLS